MPRTGPHSYFDDSQPRTRHLGLELDVDFEGRSLYGWALLDLGEPSSGPLDLDTKGLEVHSVEGEDEEGIPFELAREEPVLGRRLRINLPPDTRRVTVEYSTSPDAIGLQWLDPAQTEGKRHPFLFSHFQPIHALSPTRLTKVIETRREPPVRVSFVDLRCDPCLEQVGCVPHLVEDRTVRVIPEKPLGSDEA